MIWDKLGELSELVELGGLDELGESGELSELGQLEEVDVEYVWGSVASWMNSVSRVSCVSWVS